MGLIGVEESLDGLARESGVRWHWHVLRRNGEDVWRRVLDFEVVARRGH